MPRKGWAILAGIAAIELATILLNPTASKQVLRTVYVWLWTVAPKPDGVQIPDRFL